MLPLIDYFYVQNVSRLSHRRCTQTCRHRFRHHIPSHPRQFHRTEVGVEAATRLATPRQAATEQRTDEQRKEPAHR